MIIEQSICVSDFCGRFGRIYPWQTWADWFPSTGLVVFGGEWCEVPPVYSATEPNDAEIDALEDYANWMIGLT